MRALLIIAAAILAALLETSALPWLSPIGVFFAPISAGTIILLLILPGVAPAGIYALLASLLTEVLFNASLGPRALIMLTALLFVRPILRAMGSRRSIRTVIALSLLLTAAERVVGRVVSHGISSIPDLAKLFWSWMAATATCAAIGWLVNRAYAHTKKSKGKVWSARS